MFRTILAVIVGFALWSLLWLGGSSVLPGLFPNALADNGASTNIAYLLSLVVLALIASLAAGLPGAGYRQSAGHGSPAFAGRHLVVGGYRG